MLTYRELKVGDMLILRGDEDPATCGYPCRLLVLKHKVHDTCVDITWLVNYTKILTDYNLQNESLLTGRDNIFASWIVLSAC